MSAAIPETEPTKIVAGDTASWRKSFSDYPASAGWALAYHLKNANNQNKIDATADGDVFAVEATAEQTSAWVEGNYTWAAIVTKGTERRTLATGVITIQPNLAADGPQDLRSHNRRMYDSICAVLEKRAAGDVQEYTIGGRMLKKMTVGELEKQKQIYAHRVMRELGTAPKLYVPRFN